MSKAIRLEYSSVYLLHLHTRLALIPQVDNAIGLIEAIRPVWTNQQRESFLGIATADAVSKGLTAIHDARAPKADLDFYHA
jgi:hypothetical protein